MTSLTVGQGIFDMLRPMLQADRPEDMQRQAYYELYVMSADMALGDWLQLVQLNADVIREANRIAVEFCIGKKPFSIKQPSNKPITEEVNVEEKAVMTKAEKWDLAVSGLRMLATILEEIAAEAKAPVGEPAKNEVSPAAVPTPKPMGKLEAKKLAAAQPSPEPEQKVETVEAPVVQDQAAAPITKEIISQKIMGTFPGMKKSLSREKIFEILAKVGGAGCTKLGVIPVEKYGELNGELDSAIAAL